MKNILLKSILLAAVLVFLFKGGLRLLVLGWKLFLPMVALAGIYLVVRQLMLQAKISKKEPDKNLGSGPSSNTDDVIIICPHCLKPKGSCPKCQ